MRIYVDFDDCICETARSISRHVAQLFGIDVAYDEIRDFDLGVSFRLDATQLELLMVEEHRPEVLLSYDEAPGASRVIREWIAEGHEVSVVTGRPHVAFEASRTWLDEHGLSDAGLYFLNKYARPGFAERVDFSLEPEDMRSMGFDYAVEDSPKAFAFLSRMPGLSVLVFDRPWNRGHALPGKGFRRCLDWEDVREAVSDVGRL